MMHRRTLLAAAGLAAVGAHPLARSQVTARMRRVGILSQSTADASGHLYDSFKMGMRDLGWIEGQSIEYLLVYGQGKAEALDALGRDLVAQKVDVIVSTTEGIRAAQKATTTIPIVMVAGSSDPIAEGYTQDIARPTRNITGLAYAVSPERFQKELEYLKQAVPGIARVAVSWDLEDMTVFDRTIRGPLESAARNLNLTLLPPVRTVDAASVDAAFATIRAQRADALLILVAGSAAAHRERIAANAIAQRLPTVAAFRIMSEGGVLMSYGPDLRRIYVRAAEYVDRILKGAKTADLPIELPRSDELIINLKTARALGLTIPQPLLLRADAIIQ